MTLENLRFTFLICFIAAAVLFIIAVLFYFIFDVTYIISTLSGYKERRELKKIRTENRRKKMSVGRYFLPGEEISSNEEEDLSGEEATTFLYAENK